MQLNFPHYEFQQIHNARGDYFATKVIALQYVKMNGRIDCSIHYSRGCDLSRSILELTLAAVTMADAKAGVAPTQINLLKQM